MRLTEWLGTLLRGSVGALTLSLSGFALSAMAASNEPCREVVHKGDAYVVCTFDPDQHRVSLHLEADGEPFGSIAAFRRTVPNTVFAMNAGMYHHDLSPVGLYVEDGREKTPLVTNDGWGNFHLLPNGVFAVVEDNGVQRFVVRESLAFERDRPANIVHATQSGPMLVIDGALHPRFLPRSDSLKIRNGVGVTPDGRVHFAISREPVRFHDFGTLYRDAIGTPNALFLDGTISTFETDGFRRTTFRRIGPILSVSER